MWTHVCCTLGVLQCPYLSPEVAEVTMLNDSVSCMQALHPLIQADEADATKDNAAGAVGRMISSFGAQLPLDQVLPGLLSKPLHQSIILCT